MKNLIFLLLVSILVFSCNSNDDNQGNNSFYNYARGVQFRVSSTSGIDLLNPNNTGAYLEENIKTYNLIDGEVVEAYYANATNPRGFSITSPEDSGDDKYRINVHVYNPELENVVTYIEWNETDTDTIKSNSVANGNSLVLTQAWYNNNLLIDESTENLPEIIKN